jgi:hypothetical protein
MLLPIAWLANKLYAIEEKSKEVANTYRHRPCWLVYCLAQRCKLVFSAMITLPESRSYKNQFVHRAVSKLVKTALIKHCYNCKTIQI